MDEWTDADQLHLIHRLPADTWIQDSAANFKGPGGLISEKKLPVTHFFPLHKNCMW
jgi:hypothetical protein